MLDKFKKLLKLYRGPEYKLEDEVVIIDGSWLPITRIIKAIGFNNKTGVFVYALDGINYELFESSRLIPKQIHHLRIFQGNNSEYNSVV